LVEREEAAGLDLGRMQRERSVVKRAVQADMFPTSRG
jgi:hypothetical protein